MSGLTIEDLIERRHQFQDGWLTLREASNGIGGSQRRADLLAFQCWRSKGFERVGYEVKRSRADFASELEQPDKRAWLEKICHRTFFAVAPDVCDVSEIPEGWGLLELTKTGTMLRRKKVAPPRTPVDPTPRQWLAWMRRFAEIPREMRARMFTLPDGRADVTLDDVDAWAKERLSWQLEELDRRQRWYDEEAKKAKTARSKLEEPLLQLQRLSKSRQYQDRDWKPVDELTAADVDRLAERLRLETLGLLAQRLEDAERAIRNALDGLRATEMDLKTERLGGM